MKILRYGALIVFSLIWLVGISPYPWLFPGLYRSGFLKDEYRYGDLYHLSSLPQFKELMTDCPTVPAGPFAGSKPVNLYLLGDSFSDTARLSRADFGTAAYYRAKWDHSLHIKPDTSATNIVLLESVERHLRQHFETPPLNTFVPDTANFVVQGGPPSRMAALDHFFESGRIEGQIDLLLFNNPVATWIKEAKAWFNYKWFNRPAERVALSKDGRTLVYYLDTDTLRYPHTSGFSYISDQRIDSVVHNVNTTAAELKRMGFDHVILSVIPNKSSILIPDYGRYNRLVARVQEHPALEVPFVDVLPEYRQLGAEAYLRSDSHWTCKGRAVWLEKTNTLIRRLVAGEPTGPASAAGQPLSSQCSGPVSTRSLISASPSR